MVYNPREIVNLYMPYKEKLMKTKTAFTTAAILFAFSTGSALAADEKSVFKNVPSPIKKIYCGISEDALLQKFKEKNSLMGFSYFALDDPMAENKDDSLYYVTHDNSLFLMRQISDLYVEARVNIEESANRCTIFSEDISDYKSYCLFDNPQGLDYAIKLYADDQRRVEARWQEKNMMNKHRSKLDPFLRNVQSSSPDILNNAEINQSLGQFSDEDSREKKIATTRSGDLLSPERINSVPIFPGSVVRLIEDRTTFVTRAAVYSLVRAKDLRSGTVFTSIFSKNNLEDPDMKLLVEKVPNYGCWNISEIEEK